MELSQRALVRPANDGSTSLAELSAADAMTASESEPPPYVYVIGRVEARFPSLAVEKEFAQVTRQAETRGLTDQGVMHATLSDRANRYLAKQVCWVVTIEGVETYLLHPTDSSDLELLIDSIRPNKSRGDVDVVIGVRGPLAPPNACNGLIVPIVAFSQIYSFDINDLVKSIKRPSSIKADDFERVAAELFDRFAQIADNAGATDEERALNYLAVRYEQVYHVAVEMHGKDYGLLAFETRPSRLTGSRNIIDTIFSFRNRKTDMVEKYYVRVDVTEEYPFIHSPLTPFFDR